MSKLDELYDIRLAVPEDIPNIKEFIAVNWKKDHILVRDSEFFEYEMMPHGEVNFILAVSKKTNQIEGLQGFLPASKNKEKLDIWGVVWKAADGAVPMLGMELKRRLMALTGARYELGVGANPKTAVPILKFMKYYTGKMHHYYMLDKREDYKIAVVKHYESPEFTQNMLVRVQEIFDFETLKKNFDFSCLENMIPFKDEWYLEHRYFQHPIYTYRVFAVFEESETAGAVIVAREQEQNGEKVLRVVDFLGEQKYFSSLGKFFTALLPEYEYIDMYVDGFSQEYICRAGFTQWNEQDENIIPDYFFPFEQRNVDIWVNSSTMTPCTFLKADGDQDRPS